MGMEEVCLQPFFFLSRFVAFFALKSCFHKRVDDDIMTMNSSNANGNAMAVKATLSIVAALVACFVIHKRNLKRKQQSKEDVNPRDEEYEASFIPSDDSDTFTINSAYLKKIYLIISAVSQKLLLDR